MHDLDAKFLKRALEALGAHLEVAGSSIGVLIVGGAALALRGWVPRTTHDVDILAMADQPGVHAQLKPPVFPEVLELAVARVARDFGLPQHWFNAEVGMQWHSGMPATVNQDVEWHRYGGLTVGLAGRQTLITLKLYAAADQGPRSVHAQDLIALAPTDEELADARQWVIQQDALEEYAQIVDGVILHVCNHR